MGSLQGKPERISLPPPAGVPSLRASTEKRTLGVGLGVEGVVVVEDDGAGWALDPGVLSSPASASADSVLDFDFAESSISCICRSAWGYLLKRVSFES